MQPQTTAATLNKLIRTCRDGEAICRIWSHAAGSPDVRDLLRERSQDWSRQGDELQALVLLLGGCVRRAVRVVRAPARAVDGARESASANVSFGEVLNKNLPPARQVSHWHGQGGCRRV